MTLNADMPIIQSHEAGDILHRGDIICWRQDVYYRSWVQNRIIAYQQNTEMLPYPDYECSHTLVVTGGRDWRGWELANTGGREVYLLKDNQYHDGQFIVLRYHFPDDEMRYRFCDYAANIAASRYSWTGVLHLATRIIPALPGGRFCSEQVQEAAIKAGIRMNDEGKARGIVDTMPSKTTPARIANSPYLQHIATVYHKRPL